MIRRGATGLFANRPGIGRSRGRPVDGASVRDLRAEGDARYVDAQLTALVPRPQS